MTIISDDEVNELTYDEENGQHEVEMEKAGEIIESSEIKDLKKELNKLISPMKAPPMFPLPPVKCENPEAYPDTYRYNSKKEQLVLAYVENFKRQFQYIYPDRRYLFLNPLNECGIEKFVCTSIRPTSLPFSKIYDWHECAKFVSEYLQFEAIKDPCNYPPVLWSLTKTLKDQRGNCYAYSMLLASLLIGAGYDAYVVNGYATRETCNMDESRTVCPLLIKNEVKKQENQLKEAGKYSVKQPKDLRSKFLLAQEDKVKNIRKVEAEKRKKEQEDAVADLEKPPPDHLHGSRIHSWVLVLSGNREVSETFFIETLTGNAKSTHDPNYLGLEAIWNHKNYWVNMQKCIDGCAGLVWDLGDSSKWEYMFPSNEKPELLLPSHVNYDGNEGEEEIEEKATIDGEKYLDLPSSWVSPINISAKDFEKRCPEGKKLILYKKCKVEKFAPYLLKDNMILKISEYSDYELIELKRITEKFMQRFDKLVERVHDFGTGWVVEKFDPARSKFLKEHKYIATKTAPENERVMHFYHEARFDGLKCREESPTEMAEHYVRRSDFLCYRRVIFGKKQKKFGPQDGENFRPILKIVDRFERNHELAANEDIAELIYNIEQEKFQITYHRMHENIAPSTREFSKPPNWADKGSTWTWNSEYHQDYQSNTDHKKKRNVELYQMLVELLEKEEHVKSMVRKSEEEVRQIINERTDEESKSQLTISVYDTERNDKARRYKQDLEKKIMEEKLKRQTFEADYLAPFLAEKGIYDPREITQSIAIDLKERCLADLKQRLLDEANLIQKRYEQGNVELQKKQHWYQSNQINMSKDDEQEYVDYCAEAMFRIHILELRLNRHKEKAPHVYALMEQRLKADDRLKDFLI